MKRLVVGTAGHVDHGKTSLVKSLTGIDTDRWEEEKRRGITMDLGFADLELGDVHVSIVDVPGHEDFVRNMVAGATGIDAVLLVVAADEGFMPQTLEHLSILEFLNVPAGIPVITKVDIAEEEWLELVNSEVVERLAKSPIRWLDPVNFSAVTDQGLDELKSSIRSLGMEKTSRDEGELFRMPVDRSFTVAGTGTVVTGTVWSGSVKRGETVSVLPGGVTTRIRAIQAHGKEVSAAIPGRRAALALTGVEKSAVGRGEVVVTGDAWRSAETLDVAITLSPGAKPLGQRSRVRVHLGTAEVMARVTPAEGEIVAGVVCGARLRLETPVVARWGDRGVLRTYSPMVTIGGFTVVDPFPPARPRRPVNWKLKSLEAVQSRAAGFMDADGQIAVADLPVRLGFGAQEFEWINSPASGMMITGAVFLSLDVVESRLADAAKSLARFHRAHPLEPGMPLEELRSLLAVAGSGDAVLEKWAADGGVEIDATFAKTPGFEPSIGPQVAEKAAKIMEMASDAGFQGVNFKEFSVGDDGATRDILGFLRRSGQLIRVGTERYYGAEVMDRLIAVVVQTTRDRGEVSPADLREQTGLTRKYLIPLLEWMDAEGITARNGDVRLLGPRGRVIASEAVDKS